VNFHDCKTFSARLHRHLDHLLGHRLLFNQLCSVSDIHRLPAKRTKISADSEKGNLYYI